MDNMSKAVVKKGKDTTKIEIGSKRLKIVKILAILAVVIYLIKTIIELF